LVVINSPPYERLLVSRQMAGVHSTGTSATGNRRVCGVSQ
jgi:hypothetical protein